jgi:hypothetical protein
VAPFLEDPFWISSHEHTIFTTTVNILSTMCWAENVFYVTILTLYKSNVICPVVYIRTDRAGLRVPSITHNLYACMTWYALPSMRHAGHHNALALLNVRNIGFYTDLKSLKLHMLQLHSSTQLSNNLKTHLSRNQASCRFSQEEYLRTHVWSNGLTK